MPKSVCELGTKHQCSGTRHLLYKSQLQEKVLFSMCAKQRFISVCAFAQSDQNIHWAQFGYPKNAKFLSTDTKDSDQTVNDQTAPMRRLIRVFVERTSDDTFPYFAVSISTYSRLSLSRSPRDSMKFFEISIPRHTRFAKLIKNK